MTEEEFFKTAPVFGGGKPAEPSSMPSSPANEDQFFKSAPQYTPSAASPAPPAPNPAVDKAVHLTSGRPPAEDMSLGDMASKAWQNAPRSAVEFGKNLVQPFLEFEQTATAIGQLGQGLASKGKGLLGFERDTEKEGVADAMGQFFKDRYGSVDAMKRTFSEDPVGMASDLASVLTLGGGAAAKAPGIVGKAGAAARSVGTAIDPISAATKAPAAIASGASYLTNLPLAFQTGTSIKSLNQATKAGVTANPVFWNHLHGNGSVEDVVKSVRDAVGKIAQDRSDSYIAGMGSIASSAAIPYKKVDDALRSTSSIGMSRGRIVNQEAADVHAKLNQVINDWRSHPSTRHNLEDFDLLKRRIRDVGYTDTMPGTPARKIVDDIANAVKDSIPDKRYADIMEQYSATTQKLNDLNKDVLGSRKASTGAQIRKILKAQDDAHKSKMMAEIAEINPDIPFMIAGQELRPLLPEGMVGKLLGTAATYGGYNLALHPGALAAGVLSIPRVAGTLQYGVGRVGGMPESLRQAYPAAGPALFQAGRAEEVTEDRPQRASGGRINPEAMADRIMGQIDRARREFQSETGNLLNHDDETIVKALKVANERI